MAASQQFVIVRELPGIGASSQEQLAGASETSNKAIAQVDGVKWLHSYVVADRTYCIYEAPSVEAIKKHAEISGFPTNVVEAVQNVISPATADSCPSPLPEHMSPLTALAASERASIRPRRRLLWLLQCGAQLESNIARGASDWRKMSFAFDVLCLSAMVFAPMAPAQSALNGRGALPMPFLWAPYLRWLGRLSFGGRRRGELRRRALQGSNVQADRFAGAVHDRVRRALLAEAASSDGKQVASHPLAWHSWELLVYSDGGRSGSSIADGSGGATSFSSGDLARVFNHLAVSEHFVRFCMLHREGADMLAGAFAKEAARILSGHEAEELLLRAVVAPTAERCLALGGLDEPRYRYRGGGAGTPAVAASSDPRPQDLLDELVVVASVVASGFLQMRLWGEFRVARDADAGAAAPAIAVAGGYSPNCLSKLEAATEKAAKISRGGNWADKPRRRRRFSWWAVFVNDPALRYCRKETLAVMAVAGWLRHRRG